METPRILNNLLRRVRDFAEVEGNGKITHDISIKSLDALKIDKKGLDEMDNKIIDAIVNKFNGGPVGIKTIATACGEEANTIEEVYEPFLVQEGYIKRTQKGRVATERSYNHLGINPKGGFQNSIFELKKRNSQLIKRLAKQIGFSSCGISRARFLHEEEKNFEDWLNQGYQGTMSYLERNFDKRLDPTKLVPGAKSIISLTFNYFPPKKIFDDNSFLISKYAYGKDYHIIIKDKLKALFSQMKKEVGDIEEGFVDSAPIHERAWAKNFRIRLDRKKLFTSEQKKWEAIFSWQR